VRTTLVVKDSAKDLLVFLTRVDTEVLVIESLFVVALTIDATEVDVLDSIFPTDFLKVEALEDR
jgi:hypothetical protein